MKKKMALLMVVVMVVLTLTGCGKKEEETITLTLWHSFGSTVSQDVIDDFIEMYEKDHPNIKIVQENAQIEEYQFRKLKVAVANNSQGDVFLSYGGGYSQSIVDAGAALPLSSYLKADKTYDRMQNGVLEYVLFSPCWYRPYSGK